MICVDWFMMCHTYMLKKVPLVSHTNINIDDLPVYHYNKYKQTHTPMRKPIHHCKSKSWYMVWNLPISSQLKNRHSYMHLLVDNPVQCCKISKYHFTWIHMLISCSASERKSVSLSLWVSLCGWTMGIKQRWRTG
jgi:hypothetical protein